MADFLSSINQFLGRNAPFFLKSMQTVIQIICQYQHLLERARQLGKILEPVTAGAKLWPTERFRRSANSMYTVTLSAV